MAYSIGWSGGFLFVAIPHICGDYIWVVPWWLQINKKYYGYLVFIILPFYFVLKLYSKGSRDKNKEIHMSSYYKFSIITFTLLYIFSCAGTVKAPKWYNNPPKKKGYIYAVGTEISDRRQSAISQARDEAAADLAAKIQTEVERQNERVLEEVADKTVVNVWTSAQKTLVAQTLQNYNEVKSEVKQPNRKSFEAFVLLELNLTAAQDRMLDDLEKDAKIMAKLRKSDLIQEMEKDIEAYRKRRGY